MIETQLTERKKQILKLVTDAYIASGEPIGSKHIQDLLRPKLSSATIRNEMADLEEMGYLSHPHTSAGRVPTTRGYRVYVDSLMENYSLSFKEKLLLNALISDSGRDSKDVISDMSSLLSEMTGYAVLILSRENIGTIERFDGIFINLESFLLVMLTSSGKAITKEIHTGFPINSEAVNFIIEVLNDQLAKKELGSVTMERMYAIEEALGDYKSLIGQILKAIYDVMGSIGRYKSCVSGLYRLFDYPEFDNTKMKVLMQELENKEDFTASIADNFSNEVRCHIGSGKDGIDSISYVNCPFTIAKKINGIICIIGPNRMDYAKVMARLGYLAKEINAVHGFKPTLPLIETKEIQNG